MKIEQIGIDQLKPYKDNPRINKDAVDKVAKSIQQFGFRQPIVADKDYTIIAGHTRWLAAKQLGLKTVPVHIAHELTEQQAKAYRLVDNRTANFSDWDMALLAEELKKISLDFMQDFEFDKILFNPDILEENFNLPSGDKQTISQITFNLTTEQYNQVQSVLKRIKKTRDFSDFSEKQQNINSNGNALYYLCLYWSSQNPS